MGSLFSRPSAPQYIPPPPAPPPPVPTYADAKRDVAGQANAPMSLAGGTDVTKGAAGSDAPTNRKTLLGQ
jgi:hypothetical protein